MNVAFTLPEGIESQTGKSSKWRVRIEAAGNVVTVALYWGDKREPTHEFHVNKENWLEMSEIIQKIMG